ncbi:MAG: metal ABC transporter ATP-binding protein [Chloroflexi bacterium]|nr:metal ABC transporter ATP-binding protein [Chloroflexota bacterium]
MAEPVLALEGITFGYDSEPVLQDVHLAIARGEFLALIGPNGSGKTTLLRIAVGLLKPWRGIVHLFGEELAHFRGWARLGYVPQRPSSNVDFPATVQEVVASGRTPRLGLFHRPGRADHEAVNRALDLVGMAAYSRRLIGELSGGQRQRVQLAQALAGEPELLFLDEPAVGVDAAAKADFLALLTQLRHGSGLTIVYVSHDFAALAPHLTRVALISQRLLYAGPPAELAGREELERIVREAATAAEHRSEGI